MDNQTELKTPAAEQKIPQTDAPIQTLEKQKTLLKKHPLFFNARLKFIKLGIKTLDYTDNLYVSVKENESLAKNLEDVLAFSHYLENNIPADEQKNRPYKASFPDLARFSVVVGKHNDPVEIIERLKQAGFTVNVHDLTMHLNTLKTLVEDPHSMAGIKMLKQGGILKNIVLKHLYEPNQLRFNEFNFRYFHEGLISCLDLISRDRAAIQSLEASIKKRSRDWPFDTVYNLMLDNPLYRSRAIQIIGLDFLYRGDRAHEFLEKIKEKGWITIQTYNRLYAARRAFIGHESYAFRGDGSHPTINVTYYGHALPDMSPYPKNYQLYQQKMKGFQEINKSKFINDFVSWYDQPNWLIPIGVADNGHTHYYGTPYGVVSGCIAENKKEELLNEDYVSKLGPLGLNLVTGHKEMLADFIRRQEQHQTAAYEKIKRKNAVTIDFTNLTLPSELKEMTLPGNITLAEVLLNLYLEQYLHPIRRDQYLLDKLMKQIQNGELAACAGEQKLKLDDVIPVNTRIVLKTKG